MTRGTLFGVFVVVATCGCVDPSTLATPRTVPPGDYMATIAGGTTTYPNLPVRALSHRGTEAVVPVALRLGVSERVDLGARLGLGLLGLDAKYNFFRSPRIDVATGIGVQGSLSADNPYSEQGFRPYHVLVAVPLIVGVNVTDSVTLVPIIGYDGLEIIQSETAWISYVRGGLGVNVHPWSRVSIQPELNVLESVGEKQESTIVSAMLGLSFGAVH